MCVKKKSMSANSNNKPKTAAILAHAKQRDNPVVRLLPPNLAIEFVSQEENVSYDFQPSAHTGVLFLSIEYHTLNPGYIFPRMDRMKRHGYRTMILLVLVDCENCESALLRVQTLAMVNTFTTVLAFSREEAARYLEALKTQESRPTDDIEGRKATDYAGKCTEALCAIKGVNKSDAKTLLRNFKSMGSIMQSSVEEMALCSGIGEKKVMQMHNTFHKPFFAPKTSPAKETTTTTITAPLIFDLRDDDVVDDEEEEENDDVEAVEVL